MKSKLVFEQTQDGMIARSEVNMTDKSQLKYLLKEFRAAVEKAGYVPVGDYVVSPLLTRLDGWVVVIASKVKRVLS